MSRAKKVTAYILLVFIFQEVFFRLAFPLPELTNFDRSSFVLKVNQTGGFVRNKGFEWWSLPDTSASFGIEYNMYGFRGAEWQVKKKKGQQRIMFVGDSFTEGIMAAENQTFPSYFKKASSSTPVEVMNAGMLGVGLPEYLQFIADAVPIFRPNVVFLVLYANDFVSTEIEIPAYNLAEEYRDFTQPRLLELLNAYKEGNPVPFRKPLVSNRILPDVEDPKFPFTGKLDEMYLHADSTLVKHMLKADFNPYKLNQMFRLERSLSTPANFLVPLDFFRYYSEKYEFEPIVVYIPSRNQVTDYYLQYDYRSSLKFNHEISFTDPIYNRNQLLLAETCKRIGLEYHDLTNTITEQEQAGNHLYWNYDDHMRARGYKLIGEELHRRFSE
ncbi:MAG: SGNH/GDSL hydrolase family protein [Flavobacteriales bacterium]